jgi:SH3 domain protein
MFKLIGTVFLLLSTTIASAQSYITDKVVVGVYDQPSPESSLLKALPTGTPLEVLGQQNGYTQIRTPDGLSGWIENSYIIEHKPAQLVVLELTDKQKQTETALKDTRKQMLDMQERLAALQETGAGAVDEAELDKLKNKNRSLRNKLGEMEQELNKTQSSLQENTAGRQKLEKELAALRQAAKKEAENSPAADTTPPAESTTAPGVDDLTVKKLQNENAAMQKQLDAIYAALSLTAPEHDSPVDDSSNIQISLGWGITWVLIILLIGAGISWQVVDRLHLKRHGGFRL